MLLSMLLLVLLVLNYNGAPPLLGGQVSLLVLLVLNKVPMEPMQPTTIIITLSLACFEHKRYLWFRKWKVALSLACFEHSATLTPFSSTLPLSLACFEPDAGNSGGPVVDYS